jgi:hypothetical protein
VEHGNGWQQRSAGYCFDFSHPFLNGVQVVAGSNPVAPTTDLLEEPLTCLSRAWAVFLLWGLPKVSSDMVCEQAAHVSLKRSQVLSSVAEGMLSRIYEKTFGNGYMSCAVRRCRALRPFLPKRFLPTESGVCEIP